MYEHKTARLLSREKSVLTDSGKLFASCYALFSGIVFIGIAGIIVVPVAHRVLHKLHLADRDS
jgi:hypothetical protein